METKKKITGAVWLFTALILIYEIVSVLAWTTDIFEGITIKQNILLSQSLIFVPTVIYLILKRKHINEIIRFRKFHPAVAADSSYPFDSNGTMRRIDKCNFHAVCGESD